MGAVTPETCRVTLQWNKSDCIPLHLVGLLFNMNYDARSHELKKMLSSYFTCRNTLIGTVDTGLQFCLLLCVDMNPVTLRAERKLRVLDRRVLTDFFGSKRQKVAENCTKFLDKTLHDLQISSSIISQGTSLWQLKNKRPTWCHLLFYFTSYVSDINISIIWSLRLCCWITTLIVLFLFRCVLEIWCGRFWVVSVLQGASACNTDTTQTQPHQISNTQQNQNKTINVVIQQHSPKLLMMDILTL